MKRKYIFYITLTSMFIIYVIILSFFDIGKDYFTYDKFSKAALNGRISICELRHHATRLKLKNDTGEYILNTICQEKPDKELWQIGMIGDILQKKANCDTFKIIHQNEIYTLCTIR